jgi:fermentation-respiration switch protein FrsA (DUF1100 family)
VSVDRPLASSSAETARSRGFRRLAFLAILASAAHLACASIGSKPGAYDVRTQELALRNGTLNLNLVTPGKPHSPPCMILYATGDAGWMGVSKVIFQRMADLGYYIAAYNSREVVSNAKSAGGVVSFADAAAGVDKVLAEAKRLLGLPESTPTIVTGFSRGANLVVFAGGEPTLQRHIRGAVAIALTREGDYMAAPDETRQSKALQLDEKGRVLTYPAIDRLGSIPIAVIQSKGDKYVPAEESRRLFGPDTPTRRLYQVEASNHGFSGGQDELIKDLDDALTWITSTLPAGDKSSSSTPSPASAGNPRTSSSRP